MDSIEVRNGGVAERQLEGDTLPPSLFQDKRFAFPIRPYLPDIISQVIELARVALGTTPATPMSDTFWRWKHEANPFGRSYGLIALDETNEQAVGLRVLLRWLFHSPEGVFHAVRAVDTATHPNYQRRGIFSTLTQKAIEELTEEGVAFIYNTPNEKSLPGYLKMGWQVVAEWPLYLRPLRPARMLLRRMGLQKTPTSLQFEDYFDGALLGWDEFVGLYGLQIDDLLQQWENRRPSTGLRTVRTFEYLQWRYGQHPHIRYGIFPLEQRGTLQGFAVLRPNQRYGWQEIVLTELVVREATLGTQLLHSIRPHLRGDYLVAHFADNSAERRMVRRAGFFRVPRKGICFTVRPLATNSPNLFRPVAWDLSLGDLEIF